MCRLSYRGFEENSNTSQEFVEFEIVTLLRKQFDFFTENLNSLLETITNDIHRGAEEDYVENPINSYFLLKRFSTTWSYVLSYCSRCTLSEDDCCKNSTLKAYSDDVIKRSRQLGVDIPVNDYLSEVATGIAKLTTFYDLDIDQLVKGQILGSKALPLNIEDTEYISQQCARFGLWYEHAVFQEKLYNMLREKYMGKPDSERNLVEKILPAANVLAQSYHYFRLPWPSTEIIDGLISNVDAEVLPAKNGYNATPQHGLGHFLRSRLPYDPFMHMCGVQSEIGPTTLRCIYSKTKIPYYRGKEEILSNSPRISRFHDVISDGEITMLKSTASSGMERSRVNSGSMSQISSSRISETKLIDLKEEMESKQLSRLALRISLMTGLDASVSTSKSSAEQFQVTNYGIGGMFHPHIDCLGSPLWNVREFDQSTYIAGTGDRLATWMFYLSDVKAGGATLFTKLKIKVNPIKGSAVFWYNYLPNGEIDQRTVHAACPVLLGSKWVSNRWIRQSGQILTSLCGKTENAESFISK